MRSGRQAQPVVPTAAARCNLVYTWGHNQGNYSSAEREQWEAAGRGGAWLALRYLERAACEDQTYSTPSVWNSMWVHLREIAGAGSWWAEVFKGPRP